MKIIFETKHGSHLFGTNTPTSDQDFKGVYIPTAREILLPRIPDTKSFGTGSTTEKNTSDDIDREFYSLHKYFDMLIKGDMNAYEMLFAPLNGTETDEWKFIRSIPNVLLSRNCKGFVGYVQRQANTYGIKGDRLNEVRELKAWLLGIMHRYSMLPVFKLEQVENIEEMFLTFCQDKKHTSAEYITNNGKSLFHIKCCDRMVPLTVSFKNAVDLYENVIDNYGNRARIAASNSGQDWKAISHAVRIGQEAVELLSTGNITFPRPNAERLLNIKSGNESHEAIAEELDILLQKVEEAALVSELPEVPDIEFMNKLIEQFYYEAVCDGESLVHFI